MKTLTELRESFMSLKDDTTTGNVAGLAEPFKTPEKKKKKAYDGRTREGRKFVERMNAKKAAREAKKNNSAAKDSDTIEEK